MNETLRLMCIFAHPDDETLGMGGALAYYAERGVQTHVLCATHGERGWHTNTPHPGLAELGRIREGELRAAARVLGVHEVAFLTDSEPHYLDGDLDQVDPNQAITAIAGHIQRVRPHVVVTFSPEGHYGHPDHIAIFQLTTAALLRAAGQPAPWQVQKFYYMADTIGFRDSIAEVFGAPIRMEVDGQIRELTGWPEWTITTRIPVRPYWRVLMEAVRCHQTQLPSLGPLPDLPESRLEEFWAQAGTFVRVFSLVNGGRALESDLFEGLR